MMNNITRLEIEQRYLLSAMPDFSATIPSPLLVTIEQGYYINDKGILVRLRKTIGSRSSEISYMQNIKQGSGGKVRHENEIVMSETDFQHVWPLTQGRRICKIRYRLPYENLVWEIDKFTSIDLVLAEVELKTVDQKPVIPPIIKDVLVREVTDEPDYLNCNLATSPTPTITPTVTPK